MQTFLPYESFLKSAECLDNKRLGRQRVEAWQILNTLLGKSKGWANHPAVLMWKGFEVGLCVYGHIACEVWKERGFKDSLSDKFIDTIDICPNKITPIAWLGNEEFHASHRSNLLRKDPAWYGAFGWTEPDNLPYVWPVTKHNKEN